MTEMPAHTFLFSLYQNVRSALHTVTLPGLHSDRRGLRLSVILRDSNKMVGYHHKIGHDHFFPHPFKHVIILTLDAIEPERSRDRSKDRDPSPIAQQPPTGPGRPHYRGVTTTLRHTQPVGLLWKSDQAKES
jgi:hypothetical protein